MSLLALLARLVMVSMAVVVNKCFVSRAVPEYFEREKRGLREETLESSSKEELKNLEPSAAMAYVMVSNRLGW